jgi:hypothetical protein
MATRTIPPSSYLHSGGVSMEKVTQWVAAVLQERINVPRRHSREGREDASPRHAGSSALLVKAGLGSRRLRAPPLCS